jgi:carbamoyl-phosphate synthase large subunit
MINVLVTSVGSNTAIGVIKALRYHDNISVTGTDTFPEHLSAGSSFVDHFYKVPLALGDDYESKLISIIQEREIQCVIPIHDIEIKRISEICQKYPKLCFWAVNMPAVIDICNDKRKVNSFLSGHNVSVPDMYHAINEIVFPVIYKPNEGGSSKGIRVFASMDEGVSSIDLEKGFLQRMIRGEEYTVDCYSAYRSDYFNCCVRKRIETKEGISTKGVTMSYPLLEELAERIHQVLHFKGASNIQFMVEDDVPYFIEINPRFSGGGILSYYAGLNSPLFTALESIQSPQFEELKNKPIRKGVYMTRYWEEDFHER